MISVVIADDEERICRLITALGEWDRLGMRVSAAVPNGIEALEVIRRERVDILITDIRMPGLGGMDLIREVNQISPQTRIIIISGYSYFEYAQTAIEYGVKGYLLKPINRQELNETLQKQAEEIRRQTEEKRVIQGIVEENEQAVKRIRERLVTDLRAGGVHALTKTQLSENYRFRYTEGSFFVMVLKVCGRPGEPGPASLKIFREKWEETLAAQMEGAAQDLVTGWDEDGCVSILSSAPSSGGQIRRAARESLSRLVQVQESLKIRILSVGLGVEAEDPGELPSSFESAKKASYEYLLSGSGQVCADDVRKEVLGAGSLLDHYTRNISPALETADESRAADAAMRLKEETAASGGRHGWEVLELVRQAAVMLLMRLEVSGQGALREAFYRQTEGCSSEEELFEALKELSKSQVAVLAQNRQDDSNRAVRMAKQYIQQHYMEPLTLELVAQQVQLTDAYFSVLFKKETGEGFAKYLSSVRLDMAKRLLRETSYPVAEVCRQVGYNDVKHFTRIFEKSCGVTPSVYRKLYG